MSFRQRQLLKTHRTEYMILYIIKPQMRHLANLWPIITMNLTTRLISADIVEVTAKFVLCVCWNISEWRIYHKSFFHAFPKRTENDLAEWPTRAASEKSWNKVLTTLYVAGNRNG